MPSVHEVGVRLSENGISGNPDQLYAQNAKIYVFQSALPVYDEWYTTLLHYNESCERVAMLQSDYYT